MLTTMFPLSHTCHITMLLGVVNGGLPSWELVVDLAGDVTLEASHGLFLDATFVESASDVVAGSLVADHAGGRADRPTVHGDGGLSTSRPGRVVHRGTPTHIGKSNWKEVRK